MRLLTVWLSGSRVQKRQGKSEAKLGNVIEAPNVWVCVYKMSATAAAVAAGSFD